MINAREDAPKFTVDDPVVDSLFMFYGPMEDGGVEWHEAHCMACWQFRRGGRTKVEDWAYLHVVQHTGAQ